MLIDQVRKLFPAERLLYFMEERDRIRLFKGRGEPAPWTDDAILQAYRFTNVRRMDDRVSRWLMDNWYIPHYNHPNMLPAVCLARHFNLPASLEAIGFPEQWDRGRMKRILRKIKAGGATIFNAAYMVRGNNALDKVEAVIDLVSHPLYKKPPVLDPSSMRKCVEALIPCYGLGSFMAGQIVADLRWAVDGTWADRKWWAPIGPGSRRGMNRLLGRPIDTPIPQTQFVDGLGDMIALCKKSLPRGLTRRLEAIDYQNCMCEYSKYTKALLGEGRPKQLYPGGP